MSAANTLLRTLWVLRGRPPHWTEDAEVAVKESETHELLGIDPNGDWRVPVQVPASGFIGVRGHTALVGRPGEWWWIRFRWYRPHHIACWWRARRRRTYAWLDD